MFSRWFGTKSKSQRESAHSAALLESLGSLVKAVESAQGVVRSRQAIVQGVLGAVHKVAASRIGPPDAWEALGPEFESLAGPPEAWQKLRADLHPIQNLSRTLDSIDTALDALRTVRYREGEIPPDVAEYVTKAAGNLKKSAEQLPSAFEQASKSGFVRAGPFPFVQLFKLDALQQQLSECERLAHALSAQWGSWQRGVH
jgi:hypothetical protein